MTAVRVLAERSGPSTVARSAFAAAVAFSLGATLAITAYAESPTAPRWPSPVPATGQTESHPAETARSGDVGDRSTTAPDDGAVRAGGELRYRDNADGTVTDLTTGLTWEKKCAGCGGLHDAEATYRWSADGATETVWDWLQQINSESGQGFAGHSDWRIANVTELFGLVDYGAMDPAIDEAFHGTACRDGCADVTVARCSCTGRGEYWTSTTFADFPAHAYTVFFGRGLVNDRVKTNAASIRAVRGGAR